MDEPMIRPIRATDNEGLLSVLRAVRREFGLEGIIDDLHEPDEADMFGLFSRPGAAYWVVARGQRVVGGGGVAALPGGPEEVCELQRMYLLSELRGCGVGAHLLECCMEFARTAGYRRCYAETMDFMAGARRLYERTGFRRLDGPLGATGHRFTTAWYLAELWGEPGS